VRGGRYPKPGQRPGGGAAAGRIPEKAKKIPYQGTLVGDKVVKGFKSDLTINIVLPNAIHGSRKKDL